MRAVPEFLDAKADAGMRIIRKASADAASVTCVFNFIVMSFQPTHI
jgi:hypothetical protein